MKMDLFEHIRVLLGCEYISDIRQPRNRALARKIFCKMNLSEYTESEIEDMKEYLGTKEFPCEKRPKKIAGESCAVQNLAQ